MSVLNPQHDRCFLLEFLQLCGDETVGPRRQFFYDCHISETEYANHVIETEHTNASTCVIYVFLFIVFEKDEESKGQIWHPVPCDSGPVCPEHQHSQ